MPSRSAARQPRRVRLFHWKPSEAGPLIAQLRAAGYEAIYSETSQSPSVVSIRKEEPVAVVIDLSRMPSHGRYVGAWVRGSKSTRDIPLVFVGGDPAKVAKIKDDLPDAAYTSAARLVQTLQKLKPPRNPVVPKQMMTTDPARTTAQKLGITKPMRVGLIDPPVDHGRVIGPLPDGVIVDEDSQSACPVILWFLHDPGEFEAALPVRRALAAKSRLWLVWQKGRRDGLNGNFVRQTALDVGLVDYKICSLDGVWSGMVFAVKKAR